MLLVREVVVVLVLVDPDLHPGKDGIDVNDVTQAIAVLVGQVKVAAVQLSAYGSRRVEGDIVRALVRRVARKTASTALIDPHVASRVNLYVVLGIVGVVHHVVVSVAVSLEFGCSTAHVLPSMEVVCDLTIRARDRFDPDVVSTG